MVKALSPDTYKTVTTFLCKTFRPVRLTFPRSIEPKYKNPIFECGELENNIWFNDTNILTPGMSMARNLTIFRSRSFDLGSMKNKCTLDTRGQIPARYVYMLKDFFFKDHGEIDHCSQVSESEVCDFWTGILKHCPSDILEYIMRESIQTAENQKFKFKVLKSPPYFGPWEREWETGNGWATQGAEKFMDRSARLYSLGNIPEENQNSRKKRYQIVCSASSGISMTYANHQPWQKLRTIIRNEVANQHCASDVFLQVKGRNTYGQTRDLSIEENVILYEALSAEGAELKICDE